MNTKSMAGDGGPPSCPDDTWLDSLLVADARQVRDEYIADDGFTARVVSMLPLPAALPGWRKPIVIALWTTAGVCAALALPSAVLEVGRDAYRLLASQPLSLSGLASAAVAMAALTGGGAVYALRANE